jgi:hypothetical protein
MGLMLLGVLAQVDMAVSVFAPVESGKETVGEAEVKVSEALSVPDVGIPIARGDVAMGVPVERQGEGDTSFARQPRDKPRETIEVSSAKDVDRPMIKREKKASGGDEFDDIFGGLEKPGKRPKRRKQGDEFDDIFSGL